MVRLSTIVGGIFIGIGALSTAAELDSRYDPRPAYHQQYTSRNRDYSGCRTPAGVPMIVSGAVVMSAGALMRKYFM